MNEKKSYKYMKNFLLTAFVIYILILLDFTLVAGGLGRDIFKIFSFNRQSYVEYIRESTNFIPFATIKLFINGYMNSALGLWDTTLNLIGNFVGFMPLTFFLHLFVKKTRDIGKMLLSVIVTVIIVEILQLIFLTGSCDVDDLILNTSGAMIFYGILKNKRVGVRLNKLTFGVWELK